MSNAIVGLAFLTIINSEYYILLSLNIKLIIFVKEVVFQLCNSKLNSDLKTKIINKASIISSELISSNKEVIIIESFFYDIITIMYS